MQKRIFVFIAAFIMLGGSLFSQTKDISESKLPDDVKEVLNEYIKILQNATDLDDAASKVKKIFAGHLLNSEGEVDKDVYYYSLKKDFNNAKFYQYPVDITRISRTMNSYDGFQETLFEGTRYKIWIAKKDGVAGVPAPVPIIKPSKGSPKVVSVIGSL
jgi:hypothetical protein